MKSILYELAGRYLFVDFRLKSCLYIYMMKIEYMRIKQWNHQLEAT